MQLDFTAAFDADEIPLAERAIAARALRLGTTTEMLLGSLCRPYLRDIAFDETGRPAELTPLNVEAAERRADLAAYQRETAARARQEAEAASAATETTTTTTEAASTEAQETTA